MLRSTIDFRFEGPEYPGGAAGHTLNVTGYIAGEKLWILRNPAIASPGLELMTSGDLRTYWRSAGYSHLSAGKMSRPAIVFDQSTPPK